MIKRNYFKEWVLNIFQPCCIVYSSQKAKDTIAKNNLSPSEFLRPFGNFFDKENIKSPFENSTTLKSFKMDFIDKESFFPIPTDTFHQYIHSLLKHPDIYPQWKIESLLNPDEAFDDIIKKTSKNKSFPWCNEYEKTVFELLKCQKTEMYQQPLANIYMCSIEDDISIISNDLDNVKNMPKLMKDNVYIMPETKLVIVLIDKSNGNIDNVEEKGKMFKEKYCESYSVLIKEINTGMNVNNSDMWKKYKYNIDLYSPRLNDKNTKKIDVYSSQINPKQANMDLSLNSINTNESDNSNEIEITYGKFISNKEIEDNKDSIYEFLINDIYKNIAITIEKYDKEINDSNNTSIFSFFKSKKNNIEKDNEGIYKLDKVEKYLFYLGTLNFYFRNYTKAIEHFSSLLNKFKQKSEIHFLFITEIKELCELLEEESPINSNVFSTVFKQYLENGFFYKALRLLIIILKQFERKGSFDKSNKSSTYFQLYQKYLKKKGIPQTGNNSENLIFNVYRAMIWEKKAISSLLEDSSKKMINKRRFAYKFFRSALYYSLLCYERNPYLLHSYGNVILVFFSKSHTLFETNPNLLTSFYLIKEKAYIKLSIICNNMKLYEESFIFSKLSLELDANILRNNNTTLQDDKSEIPFIMKNYIDNLKLIKANQGNLMKIINVDNMSSFNVIEIDNPSLYVIENQDEEISLRLHKTSINWEVYFKQYAVVDYKQRYLILDEKDIAILKYLDNITSKKNPFFNTYHKKTFTANINENLYICFNITNKLKMDVSISSIKLVYQVITEDKISNLNINQNSFIQNVNKKITLKGNETKEIKLSITSQCPCIISIIGLEIVMFNYIILQHLFSKQPDNYLYYNKQHNDNTSIKAIHSESTISKHIGDDNLHFDTKKEISHHINSSHIHKHVLQINRNKEIIYKIIPKENNICLSYPLGDKITCYRYQCILYPIIIENNTNIYKIRKFTLFLYNSNCTKNPVLLTLNPYYTFNIRLNQTNTKTIIYIPIYSTEIGNVDVKGIIKFKDERKRQYLEIKRFSFKVFVQHSFELSLSKSVKMVKEVEEYKDAFADLLISIKSVNEDSLSNLRMKDIYLGRNIKQMNDSINKNDLDVWNYNLTENKCYRNLSLVIRYEHKRNSNAQNKHLKLSKKHLNKPKEEIDPDDPHLNEYLINKTDPNEINSIYFHLLKGFIEKQSKVILSWTCENMINDNKEITKLEGFFIFDISELQKVPKSEKLTILTPIKPTLNIKINQSFLQTIVENICTVTPSVIKSLCNKSFISLKVSFDTYALNTFTEINSYEIFIITDTNKHDLNFKWLGLMKYSHINNGHINPLILNFICESQMKGIVPLNYIGFIFKFNSKKNEYLSQIVFKPKYIEINIQE